MNNRYKQMCVLLSLLAIAGFWGGSISNLLWNMGVILFLWIYVVSPCKKESSECNYDLSENVPPLVSPEVLKRREVLSADIRACLASTEWIWYWPEGDSLSRIYVFKTAQSKDVFPVNVYPDPHGRITRVEFDTPLGKQCFVNAAYMESLRDSMVAHDRPVSDFVKKLDPEAVWVWDELDKTIRLTSSLREVRNTVCRVTRSREDGITVTRLSYQKDGKEHTLRLRKANKDNSNSSNVNKAKVVSPAASTTSVFINDEKEVAADPGNITEELLDPLDTPPISEDVAKTNASNIASDMAAELGEAAYNAELNGEPLVTFSWPEGIQTKYEAEFLVMELVKRGGYARGMVNAEDCTITLYLPPHEW